jgi:hypothetical protein
MVAGFLTVSIVLCCVAATLRKSGIPNPNPASPIFSSVLAAHHSAAVEKNPTGVALDLADHYALRAGETVVRRDAHGRKITVESFVDFSDYVPETLPFWRPTKNAAIRARNDEGPPGTSGRPIWSRAQLSGQGKWMRWRLNSSHSFRRTDDSVQMYTIEDICTADGGFAGSPTRSRSESIEHSAAWSC